jgi:hypothetical protein
MEREPPAGGGGGVKRAPPPRDHDEEIAKQVDFMQRVLSHAGHLWYRDAMDLDGPQQRPPTPPMPPPTVAEARTLLQEWARQQ